MAVMSAVGEATVEGDGGDADLVVGDADFVLRFSRREVRVLQDPSIDVDAVAVGDELVKLILVRLQHRRPHDDLRQHICQICRLSLPCRQQLVEDVQSIVVRDALVRRDDFVKAWFALLDDVHQAASTERALELPQECVDTALLCNVAFNVDSLRERARERRVDLVGKPNAATIFLNVGVHSCRVLERLGPGRTTSKLLQPLR